MDIALAEAVQHIVGETPVVRLALGQLKQDRQTESVDQGIDLCRQTAVRAPHATGSAVFLGIAGVPMNADRRAVDHLDVTLKSCRYSFQFPTNDPPWATG